MEPTSSREKPVVHSLGEQQQTCSCIEEESEHLNLMEHQRNGENHGNENRDLRNQTEPATTTTSDNGLWELGRQGVGTLLAAAIAVSALLRYAKSPIFTMTTDAEIHYPPVRDRSSDTHHSGQHAEPITQSLGIKAHFVPVNANKRQERVQHMRELDSVRFGHCGGFEKLLEAMQNGDDSSTGGTHWQPLNSSTDYMLHCVDGQAYRTKKYCNSKAIARFVCEAPHPYLEGVTIAIDRSGPFNGTGGYDWSLPSIQDIGGLKDQLLEHDLSFVGGLAAPIHTNGTIISNPPIHIHHALVFPYGDWEERGRKIFGSAADHHDFFFQSHGDSECLEEDGGSACLLYQLSDGRGFVVHNDTSGISAEVKLNDVRPTRSPALEYWFEIALLHQRNPPAARKSTFVSLNNPCFGPGQCSYMLPADPHHSVMWYQYIHGDRSHLSNGTITDFVLHSHQNMVDSAFLIKSRDDNVFRALESFRAKKQLPLILDCHHRGIGLEDAKRELLSRVSEQGGQLVCEASKPLLQYLPRDNGDVQAHEKRVELRCKEGPVDLNVGDRLIVLAFNTVHKNLPESKDFKSQDAFSDFFATYQHTIFRFTLTYSDKNIQYTPPSYFYYADTGEDFDPERFHPDLLITGTCPRTIKFAKNRRGWTYLFKAWNWR